MTPLIAERNTSMYVLYMCFYTSQPRYVVPGMNEPSNCSPLLTIFTLMSALGTFSPARSGHWTTNVSTKGLRSFPDSDSDLTRANDST